MVKKNLIYNIKILQALLYAAVEFGAIKWVALYYYSFLWNNSKSILYRFSIKQFCENKEIIVCCFVAHVLGENIAAWKSYTKYFLDFFFNLLKTFCELFL